MNVRFRIDGEMIEEQSIPLDIALEVVSRVKVLARMDIAERRRPAGRPAHAHANRRQTSFTSAPRPSLASQGEKMVLRILGGQSALIGVRQHRPRARHGRQKLRELVDRPQGFIVASGPDRRGQDVDALLVHRVFVDTRRVERRSRWRIRSRSRWHRHHAGSDQREGRLHVRDGPPRDPCARIPT